MRKKWMMTLWLGLLGTLLLAGSAGAYSWEASTGTLTVTTNDETTSWRGGITLADVKHVVIEDNVTEIGRKAFDDCRNLLDVAMGDGVQTIKEYAFDYCVALQTMDLKNVKTLEAGVFRSCNSLQTIDLQKVTSLGVGVFEYCSSLTSIGSLHSSIASIPVRMFDSCSTLRKLTLPATVNNIERGAFYACSNLRLTIGNAKAVIGVDADTFNMARNVTIIVPDVVYGQYQSDWNSQGQWNTALYNGKYWRRIRRASEAAGKLDVALNVDPANSGSIQLADGTPANEAMVTENGSIQLEAVPADDFAFAGWSYNSAKENPATFTFAENTIVTAHFIKGTLPVTLAVEPAGAGRITGLGADNLAPDNLDFSLTAVPETGYRFKGWSVGGADGGSANPGIFNIGVATTITAHFETTGGAAQPPAPSVVWEAAPGGGGSVQGVVSGDNVTVTATPDEGYEFAGWTVDGVFVGGTNPATFKYTPNMRIAGSFVRAYAGETATYPDPVNASQEGKIVGGVAYINLLTKDAQRMVRAIPKGLPEGRIARMTAQTGDATAVKLRISPAALNILQSAKIDAFELRCDLLSVYLGSGALENIRKDAAGKTFQLLVKPTERSVEVAAEWYKGGAADISGGGIALRLPWKGSALVEKAPSFYNSLRETLTLAPESSGQYTMKMPAGNAHWAADYLYYALENGLLPRGAQPDQPYADAQDKTYTRAEFAARLYAEALEKELPLRAARDVYAFADALPAGEGKKAIIVLQQAGVIAPLSDGAFGGSKAITNAQAAAWLSRLEWLKIDLLSPYGWESADDGKGRIFYSFTGKPLAGKQQVSGQDFDFGKNGIAK